MNRSKYHNRKVAFAGEIFDSVAERDYHLNILARQQAGEMVSFRRQPHYLLQAAFKKNGKTVRAIEYIADFEVQYPNGQLEVIDVKGFMTKDYSIKKKLFEFRYPHLTIIEIRPKEILKMR